MKNILVPVDLSNVTESVLDFASHLATAFGAQIWLLYVAQPHPDFVGISVKDADTWRSIDVNGAHQAFKDIAVTLADAGKAVVPILLQGPVVETIHEIAKAISADMIVLGSHGHGALYDLLVGSTSEGVIRHSRIPVSVVPVPQR